MTKPGQDADVPTPVRIRCDLDGCGQLHAGDYSHHGLHGEGPIYVVYCTTRNDGLADYYTSAAVWPN